VSKSGWDESAAEEEKRATTAAVVATLAIVLRAVVTFRSSELFLSSGRARFQTLMLVFRLRKVERKSQNWATADFDSAPIHKSGTLDQRIVLFTAVLLEVRRIGYFKRENAARPDVDRSHIILFAIDTR
jgi:hypothetical protein